MSQVGPHIKMVNMYNYSRKYAIRSSQLEVFQLVNKPNFYDFLNIYLNHFVVVSMRGQGQWGDIRGILVFLFRSKERVLLTRSLDLK